VKRGDQIFPLSISLHYTGWDRAGRLQDAPGIGGAIADIIKKLFATGTHPALEKMRAEIPAGVLDMLTIPGLRPDKVIKLHLAVPLDCGP
jgi:DNA polymerase (family 10)